MNVLKNCVAVLLLSVMSSVVAMENHGAGSGVEREQELAACVALRNELDDAWKPRSEEEGRRKAAVLDELDKYARGEQAPLDRLDLLWIASERTIKLNAIRDLQGLRVLNCAYTRVVVPVLPANLEEADFSNSPMRGFSLEIIAENLLHSKHLRKLRLSSSAFLSGADEPFFISPTVEALDLSFNGLRSLCNPGVDSLGHPRPAPGILVVGSEARRKYAASFNELRAAYDEDYIEQISGPLTLQELRLCSCALTHLPTGLPASLRELDLRLNNLSMVTAEAWREFFAQLPQLEELDLSWCQLTHLPAGLPASLKQLNLNRNNLSGVAVEAWREFFVQLPQLEELNLYECSLTHLPAGLPASLKKFDLSSNDLSGVTAEAWREFFVQLPQLEELNLYGCSLTHLPAGLPASLKKLDLNRNNLSGVAVEAWGEFFVQLPQLEELNLYGCSLTHLPAGLPASLKKLDLSWNNLSGVTAEAWAAWSEQLPHLEELNLLLCQLAARPAGIPESIRVLVCG